MRPLFLTPVVIIRMVSLFQCRNQYSNSETTFSFTNSQVDRQAEPAPWFFCPNPPPSTITEIITSHQLTTQPFAFARLWRAFDLTCKSTRIKTIIIILRKLLKQVSATKHDVVLLQSNHRRHLGVDNPNWTHSRSLRPPHPRRIRCNCTRCRLSLE